MSGPPLRRTDRAVPAERAQEMLLGGFSGRLGTVGVDGWPYVVPLLYVCMDGKIYVHYRIAVERMTGKETPLPVASRRWPAIDQTKSPNAAPPEPR